MGGAYLTLLNTIANMGVILPKTPLFALMDALTLSSCRTPGGSLVPQLACPKKLRELAGPNECTAAGTGGGGGGGQGGRGLAALQDAAQHVGCVFW
jgi:hypothetical protein